MPKTTISRDGFERVRKRVAKVQDAPRAHVCACDALAFIARNDARFERALRRDQIGQLCGRFMRAFVHQKRARLRKQVTAADCALLDRFAPTGGQLARRQTRERARVNHDAARLMKRADQIFARARVHSRLTADRSINLCEQLGMAYFKVVGKCALAKLQHTSGEINDAWTTLAAAREVSDRPESPRRQRLVAVTTAELQLREGNVEAAARTLDDAPGSRSRTSSSARP